MDEKENHSIIDEIIDSLEMKNKKKIKISKKENRNENRKEGQGRIRRENKNKKEIDRICSENLENDAYVEKITLYKVKKEEVKEEYDIIMDCDNSDYIIYQKRK